MNSQIEEQEEGDPNVLQNSLWPEGKNTSFSMVPICVISFQVVFRFPARGDQIETLLDPTSTIELMEQRNVQSEMSE